jgi:hypothetical protein
MLPDENELKQTYAGFPDGKLVKIATQQARELRPEALALLQQELQKRGLLGRVQSGIDLQFRQADARVIDRYCEVIRNLPCPHCSTTTRKLNATLAGEVVSLVFYTRYEQKLKIACPDCLDRTNNAAMLKSAFLGWWAIPSGVVNTVQSLIFNHRMKSNNHQPEPTSALREAVSVHLERIEKLHADRAQLQALISSL